MAPAPVALCVAVLLAGCRTVSPQTARTEAARLRASFEMHRPRYLQVIELENSLRPETLAWLNSPAARQAHMISKTYQCQLMERWARAYFVPREIHAAMRPQEYTSLEAKTAHQRVLTHLKERYFVLHDFQRYAQRACEAADRGAAPGKLSHNLQEFRQRLEARPRAVDEASRILASLPQ